MKYLLYYILLIITSSQIEPNQHKHTIYHLIPDYQTYHNLFTANVGPQNTVEMTEHGTGKETCAQMKACRFFIYLHEPENITKIKYTVLMTAGIHGNQLLGPTTLLYLYPLLKPEDVRIIYFPVLNPSGYDKKTRQTYPNKLDLNRDYPIDGNTKCYEGSATLIIDKLFRKYKIDLTVNLHNGDDQISWNWGTYYNQKFPKTDDYPIYSSIGTMLFYVGGWNLKFKIDPFKVGTMTQVIYPAIGTLDDWAYAGSWAESAVFRCEKYEFDPYPKEMHQGLMFLFELGIHNATQNMLGTSEGIHQPSDSNKISNGYITRALRMLIQLIKVVSPVIEFEWTGSTLIVKIEGCSTLQSLNISVVSNQQQGNKQSQITMQRLTKIKNTFSFLGEIPLENPQIMQQTSISVNYKYKCNKEWVGKGKSFLAKQRVFSGTSIVSPSSQKIQENIVVPGQTIRQYSQYFVLVITLLVLFSLFTYRLFIRRNQVSKPRLKKDTIKVESVQTEQSLQEENNEYTQVEIQPEHP